MHGFPVRTPICHIVPISRIYPPPPTPNQISVRLLQARAPWTEVKIVQMTESCLAGVGVQKVFWAEAGLTKYFPKDPAALKMLRVVNSLRVEFLVRQGDLLSRRALCGHQFPGNYRHFSSQGRVRGVPNLGGVVKTLRRSNSLFLLSP